MGITNKDLTAMGFPKSALLPGSAYWKERKTFKSRTSIWNLDKVITSRSGSTIALKASRPAYESISFLGAGSIYGKLGNISFSSRKVTMSRRADIVIVECLNENLSSSRGALSLDSFDSTTGATLDLGDGDNIIRAGLEKVAWEWGIYISSRSRLQSGTGNDIVQGSGRQIGIPILGTINLGAGNDIIEGRSDNALGIAVNNGGSIDMGAGNDRLTGIGNGSPYDSAIYSNGVIDMGDGDDEITGTSFMTNGTEAKLLMGSGDDKLIATLEGANAPIDFGSGIDRLYLPSGQCEIADVGGGWYSLDSSYGRAERISGLEFIVSKSTGAEYAFAAGTLTVA